MNSVDRTLLVCIWIICLFLLLAKNNECQAEGLQLNTFVASRHFDRSAGYNEHNPGIGIEYAISSTTGFRVGRYFNSGERWSRYYFVSHTFYRYRRHSLGIEAGKITGYPFTNVGGFLTYSYAIFHHVRLDLYVVPARDGVVGLGFSVPLTR